MDFGSIAFLIGNVLGMYLKRKPEFVNKWIPYAVIAGQMIVRAAEAVITQAGNPQPDVTGASTFAVIIAAGFWASAWDVVRLALIDTVKAVALHTIAKNTAEGVKK